MHSPESEDYEDIVACEPPRDKRNFVCTALFIIGVGLLISWNFFINAKPYFSYKLRNTTIDTNNTHRTYAETGLGELYESTVAICGLGGYVFGVPAHLLLQNKLSLNAHFCCSFIIIILCFLLSAVLIYIDFNNTQITFFIITMVTVAVMTFSSSFANNSSIGAASMLPGRYVSAIIQGQAVAGVMSACANIICISVSNDAQLNALVYFVFGLLFSCVALVVWNVVIRTDFVRYYSDISVPIIYDGERGIGISSSDSLQDIDILTTHSDEPFINDDYEAAPTFHQKMRVFHSVVFHALSVFLTSVVTLALFPALLSRVQPIHPDPQNLWKSTYFTPVLCFFSYNFGDLVGRLVAERVSLPSRDRKHLLVVLSILRVAFVPLTLLCNIPDSPFHAFMMPLDDVFYSIVVLTLGFSNGYFCLKSLLYGPTFTETPRNREIAGTLLSSFNILGLFVGGCLSNVISIFV